MKRLLSLILLLILCFSLISCNNERNTEPLESTTTEPITKPITEKNNDIELTMDNYKKYLDISKISIQNSGEYYQIKYWDDDDVYYYDGYDEIRFEATVEGASTNFIYNDVYLTIRFSGTYNAFNFIVYDSSDMLLGETFEFDITVEANVAGNGSGFYIVDVGGWDGEDGSFFSSRDYFEVTAEVINVTGSVTPAK